LIRLVGLLLEGDIMGSRTANTWSKRLNLLYRMGRKRKNNEAKHSTLSAKDLFAAVDAQHAQQEKKK
jgi:hypothetical protein